jgi:hypothetical protein
VEVNIDIEIVIKLEVDSSEPESMDVVLLVFLAWRQMAGERVDTGRTETGGKAINSFRTPTSALLTLLARPRVLVCDDDNRIESTNVWRDLASKKTKALNEV